MNWLAEAMSALELIKQGREALGSITNAVKDGRAALNADELNELNAMLANETRETQEAHQALEDAIARQMG